MTYKYFNCLICQYSKAILTWHQIKILFSYCTGTTPSQEWFQITNFNFNVFIVLMVFEFLNNNLLNLIRQPQQKQLSLQLGIRQPKWHLQLPNQQVKSLAQTWNGKANELRRTRFNIKTFATTKIFIYILSVKYLLSNWRRLCIEGKDKTENDPMLLDKLFWTIMAILIFDKTPMLALSCLHENGVGSIFTKH